ncbi:magnesium/cobalt transporter CorA [Iodidimonas sp. SYSU 1G8]|uniref:magnesium/cobalt transporter CorA n=1 Tax=Iodidimonas sp. SYSU 1G8 TaxID=3133967 RepID=UPI0031FEAFDB
MPPDAPVSPVGPGAPAHERSRKARRRLRRDRRRSLGQPAGTVIADPAAAPTHIQAIWYDERQFHEQSHLDVPALRQLQKHSDVLWIDVAGLADTAAIKAIGESFGLHRLTLEDIVNLHQRPKVEVFDHYVFIVMKMLDATETGLTEQMSIIVGQDFLITFQERPGDCFDPTRARLRRDGGQLRGQGPDALAHALIDAVIDNFFPLLERYGEAIEDLEDAVVSAPAPALIERLHGIKRDLLEVRRSVWPTRELLNALIRDENPLIRDATKVYLRDCYDHAIQLMDIVETYREIASGLLDVYLSSMSAKLNEVMKILTIIATIFIPLSFFAGVWGMNFELMPELKWRYGYPAALGFMAIVAGLLVWFFKRRGWLEWERPANRPDP